MKMRYAHLKKKPRTLVERSGKAVYLSGTDEGKRHDKKIAVQKFRDRVEPCVNEVMETACGLPNFRLAHHR